MRFSITLVALFCAPLLALAAPIPEDGKVGIAGAGPKAWRRQGSSDTKIGLGKPWKRQADTQFGKSKPWKRDGAETDGMGGHDWKRDGAETDTIGGHDWKRDGAETDGMGGHDWKRE
ncbi:collagen triple helix repeat-containing protein [Ceratobasidium sp. AG-Ba]|nr:collagen triple helix repeat-containing protein [Ceratobasidium sp. AG-Ba]QRV91691.1 collagen triple helix repeat-containing protein [Ceratobasidium sp. AG-Ba]